MLARQPCEQREPIAVVLLQCRQRSVQIAARGGVERGAEFQRQVFRQHRDARALRSGFTEQRILPRGERVEARGCLHSEFGDGDLHAAPACSGRSQNVSACGTSPTPTSFQSSCMVMPGWRA